MENIIGAILSVCLVFSCVAFLWLKYRELQTMKLMSDTFDKIEGKTPAEAMSVVRRAYPGKKIRVFREDEVEPKEYWKEDAVHLTVDANGKIVLFSGPGGDGVGGNLPR